MNFISYPLSRSRFLPLMRVDKITMLNICWLLVKLTLWWGAAGLWGGGVWRRSGGAGVARSPATSSRALLSAAPTARCNSNNACRFTYGQMNNWQCWTDRPFLLLLPPKEKERIGKHGGCLTWLTASSARLLTSATLSSVCLTADAIISLAALLISLLSVVSTPERIRLVLIWWDIIQSTF